MLGLQNFLPYACGGLAISAAAALDLKIEQRLSPTKTDKSSLITLDSYSKWRLSFIAGCMFTSALLWHIFGSEEVNNTGIRLFEKPSAFLSDINSIGLLISGFLVGAGVKLADGEVTKFAFYGIPRGSKRAIVGVALIVGVGALMATLRNNHRFFDDEDLEDFAKGFDSRYALLAPILLLTFSIFRNEAKIRNTLMLFAVGALFSTGVLFAGLAQRHKVINFLSLNKDWDPSFLYACGAAIVVNILLGRFVASSQKEALGGKIDSKFVLGCFFLGAGIGLSGLTPGSALLVTPLYLPQIALFFLPFVALGQYCSEPMGEWILKVLHIRSGSGSLFKQD